MFVFILDSLLVNIIYFLKVCNYSIKIFRYFINNILIISKVVFFFKNNYN